MAISENLKQALEISARIETLETLIGHVHDGILQTELDDYKAKLMKHPLTVEAHAEIAQLRVALVELI